MILGRALLVAAAALLAASRGDPGFPEARASLDASAHEECPRRRQAAARPPSAQAYEALMP
jgi:hypothetical protein